MKVTTVDAKLENIEQSADVYFARRPGRFAVRRLEQEARVRLL